MGEARTNHRIGLTGGLGIESAEQSDSGAITDRAVGELTDCFGKRLLAAPTSRGIVWEKVQQLRDPAIFREGGETYLLYAVAEEQGIAMARVEGC